MKKIIGYMKGVNIGGWLSQCNYSKEHLDSFITEKDFKVLKSWNIDHVRIPVDYNIFQEEDGSIVDFGFEYVDKALDWCEKYGLNMILDLHKTRGFFFDKSQQESGFFDSENLQSEFFCLWKEFAKRYAKYDDRLAFELLNEVTEPKYSEKWNEISKRTVKIIREYSPNIKIIIGSYWNNSVDALKDLDMPYDENIVYTYHCYDPFIFTHQGAYWVDNMPSDFRISYPGSVADYREKVSALGFTNIQIYMEVQTEKFTYDYFINRFKNAVKLCEERNVPLYCGEYGVINLASHESTLNWYKDINSAFELFGIGRAAWSYKGVDYGLSDDHIQPVVNELIRFL